MNILSIDYDYFQKVTEKQLKLYPDGIDMTLDESLKAWERSINKLKYRYLITSIMNDYEKLYFIADIIADNSSALMKESYTHKDIYNFIIENTSPDDTLNLYHLDMHHDAINNNDELDCGNWCSFLNEERRLNLYWFPNPISANVYGLGENFVPYLHNDLHEIKDIRFDMIFLCMSPCWVPPHLHKDYKILKENMNLEQ